MDTVAQTVSKVADPATSKTPSYLTPYSQQTQNAVKTSGLDTVMAAVNSNSNINAITKEGLTPQVVSTYKDASGNTVKAPPNTYYVSNSDGSGGALNYFFQVDPKTGVTTPIDNPVQNLTYTPGSPGGFVNQVASSIKPLVPIAEAAASAFIPGAAPIIAGYNAAQSVVSGKPITIGTALNVATALGGANILPPEIAAGVKTANQALSVANAVKTGNVSGLINSVVQMTGASSDVKAVMNGVNAATALQKGDIPGALNALNNLTGSVDPKIANLATTVLKQISPSLTPASNVVNAAASTNTPTTDTTTQNAAPKDTSVSTNTAPPTNPLQPGSTGVNWNQASTIAAGIGLPDLAHVLYYGKYFGAEYEKINPKTDQVEFTNTPQTTGLPGTLDNSATEVASSQTQEQPAAQAQPQQDSIMALIDKIMQSDTPTSASDLQNMILGA